MKKVIFVCLGNICRSPAAEGIMLAKLKEKGLSENFKIDSAGTYGGHTGSLPDERMRYHAEKRGYELVSRSRKFYPSADFSEYDMIIGMDECNVADLNRMAANREEKEKIYKMTDFCREYKNYDSVPDPYYGGDKGFELVLNLLEDGIEGLIEYINKEDKEKE